MSRYAENTSVSVDRSIAEIRKTLERYGCTGFIWGEYRQTISVSFELDGLPIHISIPVPGPGDERFLYHPSGKMRSNDEAFKAWEKEHRRFYRVLLLLIKSRLELIEDGMEDVQTAFLPYLMLPDRSTVKDHLFRDITKMIETGQVPPLLPMGKE